MTCPVCHLAAAGDIVNPGPEWGPTHRACFAMVDTESEALEREFGGAAFVYDPDGLEWERPRKHLRAPNRGLVERVQARLSAKGINVRRAA